MPTMDFDRLNQAIGWTEEDEAAHQQLVRREREKYEQEDAEFRDLVAQRFVQLLEHKTKHGITSRPDGTQTKGFSPKGRYWLPRLDPTGATSIASAFAGRDKTNLEKFAYGVPHDDTIDWVASIFAENQHYADKGVVGKAGDIITMLPSYLASFGASGALTKSIAKNIGRKALSGATSKAGRVAQAAARTGVQAGLQPKLTGDALKGRIAPVISFDADGNLVVKDAEDLTTALPKAFLDAYIETWSEKLGGSLNKTKAWQTLKNGIVNKFSKIFPGSASLISARIASVGYDGIIEEMIEERAGELARSAVGLEEGYGVAGDVIAGRLEEARDQILTELIAFSPYTTAIAAGQANRTVREATAKRDAYDDIAAWQKMSPKKRKKAVERRLAQAGGMQEFARGFVDENPVAAQALAEADQPSRTQVRKALESADIDYIPLEGPLRKEFADAVRAQLTQTVVAEEQPTEEPAEEMTEGEREFAEKLGLDPDKIAELDDRKRNDEGFREMAEEFEKTVNKPFNESADITNIINSTVANTNAQTIEEVSEEVFEELEQSGVADTLETDDVHAINKAVDAAVSSRQQTQTVPQKRSVGEADIETQITSMITSLQDDHGYTITRRPVKTTREKEAARIAERMGLTLIPVTGSKNFRGASNVNQGGNVVLVKVGRGENAFWNTVGHELAHGTELDRFAGIGDDVLAPYIKARMERAGETFRKQMESSPEISRREGLAGLFGEFFESQQFRDKLFRENPSAWRAIVERVLQVLKNFSFEQPGRMKAEQALITEMRNKLAGVKRAERRGVSLDEGLQLDEGEDIRQIKSPVQKIGTFFKKHFTPGSTTPRDGYFRYQSLVGQIRAHVKEAEGRSKELELAIKAAKEPDLAGRVDEYLKEENPDVQTDLLSQLPDDVGGIAQSLRGHIRTMSKLIKRTNMLSDKALESFEKYWESYLNRSFQVHTDPKYKADDAKIRAAIKHMKDELNLDKPTYETDGNGEYVLRVNGEREGEIDPENGQRVIIRHGASDRVLEGWAIKLGTFEKPDPLGAGKLTFMINKGILKRRKDLGQPILDLLGEYKDPSINYMQTIVKQARLWANYEFLADLKEMGMNRYGTTLNEEQAENLGMEPGDPTPERLVRKDDNTGWLSSDPVRNKHGEVTVPLVERDDPRFGPLIESEGKGKKGNIYVTKDIRDGFHAVMGTSGPIEGMFKFYLQLMYVPKMAKTVGSHVTHARNFESWVLPAMINGYIFSSPSEYARSFNTMRREVFSRPGPLREYLREMDELMVTGSGVRMGTLKDQARDVGLEGGGSEAIYNNMVTKPFAKILSKVTTGAQKLYASEDDFWKVLGFEYELGWAKKAFERGNTYEETIAKNPFLGRMSEKYGLNGMRQGAANRAELEQRFSTAEAAKYEYDFDWHLKQYAALRINQLTPNYDRLPSWVKKLRFLPIGSFPGFSWEVMRTTGETFKVAAEEMFSGNKALRGRGQRRAAAFIAVAGSATYVISKISMLLNDVSDEEDKELNFAMAPWAKHSQRLYMNGGKEAFDLTYSDFYAAWRKPFRALLAGDYTGAVAAATDPYMNEEILIEKMIDVYRNMTAQGKPIYDKDHDDYVERGGKIAAHLWGGVEPGSFSSAARLAYGATGTADGKGRNYDFLNELIAQGGLRTQEINPPRSFGHRAREYAISHSRLVAWAKRPFRQESLTPGKAARRIAEFERDRRRAWDNMRRTIKAFQTLHMTEEQIRGKLKTANVSDTDVESLMSGVYEPYKVRGLNQLEFYHEDDPAKEAERKQLFAGLTNSPEVLDNAVSRAINTLTLRGTAKERRNKALQQIDELGYDKDRAMAAYKSYLTERLEAKKITRKTARLKWQRALRLEF